MKSENIIKYIIKWLKEYSLNSNTKGFAIGISGGIDSAVTSTLASKTRIPLLCVEMPIHQEISQVERARKHIDWLKKRNPHIESRKIDLSNLFDSFAQEITENRKINELALANTRARLRMTTLYYLAQSKNYLVIGTGNRVEDFGIGFFTKYGDGGVDISPIADLLKTEIYELGKALGINHDILNAAPTDGLWGDNKTDEDQIGASYEELEWAMKFTGDDKNIDKREKEVLSIYKKLHKINQHKMNPIPICRIPENLK